MINLLQAELTAARDFILTGFGLSHSSKAKDAAQPSSKATADGGKDDVTSASATSASTTSASTAVSYCEII